MLSACVDWSPNFQVSVSPRTLDRVPFLVNSIHS